MLSPWDMLSCPACVYVYHTGTDTLTLTFFFGIRHHADLQGKQRAALGSLSHMETGPIVRTEQLMENCRHLP